MSGRGRPVRKIKARRLFSPSEFSNPDNNPSTSKKTKKNHSLSDSPFSSPLGRSHSQIDQTAGSPLCNSIPDNTPVPEIADDRLVNSHLGHDTTVVNTSNGLGLDPVFHFEDNQDPNLIPFNQDTQDFIHPETVNYDQNNFVMNPGVPSREEPVSFDSFDTDFIPVSAHVAPAVRQKIINGQFVNFEKLIESDDMSDDDSDSGEFIVKDGVLKVKKSQKKKGDISYTDWVGAWNIFSTIVARTSNINDIYEKLAKHFQTVRELEKARKDWRYYDTQFRKLIAAGLAKWGSVKSETYSKAFLRDSKTQKNSKNQLMVSNKKSQNICRLFQSNSCYFGSNCKYLHICRICHSPSHPMVRCYHNHGTNSSTLFQSPFQFQAPYPNFVQRHPLTHPQQFGNPTFRPRFRPPTNKYSSQYSFTNLSNSTQPRHKAKSRPAISN